MRNIFIVLIVGVLLGACGAKCLLGADPVLAAQQERHYTPLHHNIPATFKGHPEGRLIYLCATQPRAICNEQTTLCVDAEDHYLQYETCPDVPIK